MLARGFTLIELLWTIALFGVLITAGVPMMNNLLTRYKADSDFRSFRSLVSYARAEALVRRRDVVLCPTQDNADQCYSGGIGTDEQESDVWKQGWILFVDWGNSPTSIDASEGDTILKIYEAADQRLLINRCGSSYLTSIAFNSRGNSSPSTFSVRFSVEDNGEEIFGKRLIVSSGRVRMDEEACS